MARRPGAGRRIARDDISQLYCASKFRFYERSDHSTAETARHSLRLVTNSGREVVLLEDVIQQDAVLYLEQAIEDHLGLFDSR